MNGLKKATSRSIAGARDLAVADKAASALIAVEAKAKLGA